MGFALRQEEISLKPSNGQVDFQFCARARETGLYDAFEKLSENCERMGSQLGLYNWVFTKFKQVCVLVCEVHTCRILYQFHITCTFFVV